jgi:hypothetical protein
MQRHTDSRLLRRFGCTDLKFYYRDPMNRLCQSTKRSTAVRLSDLTQEFLKWVTQHIKVGMGDEFITFEMTCVAVTALLAVVVTIPFIVAYGFLTAEEWFCDGGARQANLHQVGDGSQRPAPRPPEKLSTVLARENTPKLEEEGRRSRSSGRFAASERKSSPCAPASSKRVELDVPSVARQALGMRKRVFNCFAEDSETDIEMDISLEVQAEVPRVHTTGIRATALGRETHKRTQRFCAAWEPGSTFTASSKHKSGSTSGRTEQALPGTVTKQRVQRARRAFSYTRRQDLYPISEDDLQAAMANTV